MYGPKWYGFNAGPLLPLRVEGPLGTVMARLVVWPRSRCITWTESTFVNSPGLRRIEDLSASFTCLEMSEVLTGRSSGAKAPMTGDSELFDDSEPVSDWSGRVALDRDWL